MDLERLVRFGDLETLVECVRTLNEIRFTSAEPGGKVFDGLGPRPSRCHNRLSAIQTIEPGPPRTGTAPRRLCSVLPGVPRRRASSARPLRGWAESADPIASDEHP
jgi:hypothetical protein